MGGGGRGIFSSHEFFFFFAHCLCAGIFFFRWTPLHEFFFSDKYCFLLNSEILIHYLGTFTSQPYNYVKEIYKKRNVRPKLLSRSRCRRRRRSLISLIARGILSYAQFAIHLFIKGTMSRYLLCSCFCFVLFCFFFHLINWIGKLVHEITLCYLRLTLGTETVPCGLFSAITDGKDRHGLKLGEVGPTFSSFNVVATKITQK